MAQSRYRISITVPGERQIVLYPGSRGERDLIEDILARLPNVGIMRTDAQVRQAIRAAIEAALLDLKSEVDPR